MAFEEQLLCGVFPLSEGKRLRFALAELGVELELRTNPETCSTGGCTPTVEVYVPASGADQLRAFLEEEHRRDMGGLGELAPVPGAESLVFDREQPQATCPACGTCFDTKLTECPDCGLCFGAGE
jgi:hypothetical protein